MKLETYLRSEINNRVYPFIKKRKCEICGSNEGLELHHEYQLITMIDDTLIGLSLKYKDVNEYSEIELDNIKHIIIGKHFTHESRTVCNICHDKIHKENGKHYSKLKIDENRMKRLARNKEIAQNILFPYLDNIVGIRLFKADQEELKLEFENAGLSVKNDRKMGMKTMNAFMEDNDIPFKIESSRITVDGKKHTIWTIFNILE